MDVLLIIDMQDASFYESDTFDSDGVISRINQLSEYLRANEGRVIFIQHDGTAEEGLSPNTSGWEILSALTRTDSDIIIRKTTNDAFYNTELHDILAGINPEKLIISGWATDFCVDTTVRSSVSHNYNVVVASDCHTLSNRAHLKAERVIEHHNWVWRNLITPAKAVEVIPLLGLCS
jgi:nicotinamidase-related amidase